MTDTSHTNYFDGCKTPDEAKKRWRDLCMKHHPDKGGDGKIFNDLHQQYIKFQKVKDKTYNEKKFEIDFVELINSLDKIFPKFYVTQLGKFCFTPELLDLFADLKTGKAKENAATHTSNILGLLFKTLGSFQK